MKLPSVADLSYWNDAVDLLNALYRVGREPIPALRDQIAVLLDHPDSDVREESMRILLTRWKDDRLRHLAFAALDSDPAINVQIAATTAIAATANPKTQAADTRVLAAVLRDRRRHPDVSQSAYDALIILHRKEAGTGVWPFPTKRRAFDLDRDVDWSWIKGLER
jgi:hypothetical protein